MSNIQWYIKEEEDTYTAKKEHYAGTFQNEITIELSIWNNRFGTEDAEDIANPMLYFYFDTLEDSTLLKFCTASVEGHNEENVEIEDNKGYVDLKKSSLKGTANQGLLHDTDNYVNIALKFDFQNEVLRHGLKNLYFEIIER